MLLGAEEAAAPPVPTLPLISAGEKLGDAWTDPRNPVTRVFGGRRLDLWSFKPISDPAPPPVRDANWPRQPLDHFILAKLEAANQSPAPEADARTLCRRLYFGLTGLPPSPEEVEEFAQECAKERGGARETGRGGDPEEPNKASSGPLVSLSPPLPISPSSAYDRLVDKLLAKPEHGEHTARLWLDAVRYSDSNGFDWDEFRPQAWRFRDYVIRSLNADKPFDVFAREQLAGDEMVPATTAAAATPRDAAEQDRLIATGYLRLGPHDNSATLFGEGPRVRAALMNDLVETTGAAFLGLTLSCARCHHHKFDPVTQADYYRFRAFFEGVKFADALPLDLAPEQEAIRQANEKIEAQLKEKRAARDQTLQAAKARLRAKKLSGAGGNAAGGKEPEVSDEEARNALTKDEKKDHEAADAGVKALEKTLLPFTTGLLMADENAAPPETRVLYQGDLAQPREVVPPGFLSALDPNPAAVAPPARENSSGRRTALANWLVSRDNPLAARVIVNRVWQAHFGAGLVATPNDFGLAGARPSHPELLDWLAREFMRGGWSLKKLHRLIVTSAAYRQGAPSLSPSSAGAGAVPVPFAGQSPRRLGAEALRDAMLSVAGCLTPCAGGPPVWPEVPSEVLQTNPAVLDDNAEKTKGWYPSPPEKQGARSIYLVQKRNLRVPLMETFDLPDNSVSCPQRLVSTVAPQALTLLNSPFAHEMARSFADRVRREAGDAPAAQVARAFALALQRAPDEGENASCLAFLQTHSLPELCRALLNLNEFAYVD